MLAADGIGMSYSLGFTDRYALAVSQDVQGVETISDLARHPELRLALNPEFAGRKDGWKPLAEAYGLKPNSVSEMQHELCYEAIGAGKVDVINVYTTDAQITRFKLKVLRDDKGFFPSYDCVLLYRADLPSRCPKAWAAMQQLVGRISEARMSAANAKHQLEKQDAKEVAADLLQQVLPQNHGQTAVAPPRQGWNWSVIGVHVLEHLKLVSISLLVAICIGIPLGVLASTSPFLANLTLSATALLQTIPSLALLAFLVPMFGVGIKAALIALLVYSLLPIVRNTYTGLTTIPGNLSEAAEAIGLSPGAQLFQVRLPMASPSILAGIKTSAVINVGTATLAALVGAGGLGSSIIQGINLLDNNILLQGAIPAAALALLVQGFFDQVERVLVPKGLRL
jgi:osmoprotectant transport system permease protein